MARTESHLRRASFRRSGRAIRDALLRRRSRRHRYRRKHTLRHTQRFGLCLGAFSGRHVAVLDHPIDDPIAPIDGTFALGIGIVIVRAFRQRREISDFSNRQFIDRLVEVIQRRCRDPVIAHAEINLVEIELEDLLFRIGGLDPEREQRLANLAGDVAFRAEEEVLGDLLGDGRSALHVARALDEDERGAGHALEIDAAVMIEILILGRDESFFHQGRDRKTRQIEPPLLGIFGQHRAVRRMNAGHHRRFVILELRIIRQILLELPNDDARRSGPDDENDRQAREDKAEKPGQHNAY